MLNNIEKLGKKESILYRTYGCKETLLLFYLGALPMVIVINAFFSKVPGVEYAVSFIISASYFFSFYFICIYKGPCSIANLFWLCLGLFGVLRFVLYVFGIFDFTNSAFSKFTAFVWERETVVKVASYYMIFMAIFSNVAISSFENKISESMNDHTAFTFSHIQKPVYLLFYFLAPYTAFLYYKQARAVIKLGYTNIYNGGLGAAFSIGILSRLAMLVFTIAFYVIVCFERRLKYFDIAAACYLCVKAVPLLQGSRAIFITSIMTIAFLRFALFNKSISFKWIIAGSIVCIPGLVMISYIRNGISISEINIIDTYKKFVVDLSGSLNVVAYYLQNKSLLPDNVYPYILEPIVRIVQYLNNIAIYKMGQSLDMVAIRYNLGHQLSFAISTDYYLSGANVASNFIAEMAEFGILGVAGFSFLISILIDYVERAIIKRNAFFLFMSVEFCSKIFMLPRAEAFYDTYNLAKYGACFIALFIVARVIEDRFRLTAISGIALQKH